ncbi:hypothetical protein Bbelb_035300 [Branchiostoma belcheri]|nr:hypothetical protein Bbelb_035300 [Branchiostoma belcheri]
MTLEELQTLVLKVVDKQPAVLLDILDVDVQRGRFLHKIRVVSKPRPTIVLRGSSCRSTSARRPSREGDGNERGPSGTNTQLLASRSCVCIGRTNTSRHDGVQDRVVAAFVEKYPSYKKFRFRFDGLPCIIDLFKAGDWFIKFDLLDGYHHWNSLPGPVVMAPNVESGRAGGLPALAWTFSPPPPQTAPLAGLFGGTDDEEDEGNEKSGFKRRCPATADSPALRQRAVKYAEEAESTTPCDDGQGGCRWP